ncbi:hypothetical protein NDU88_002844 [Pleurodeles waltl]|uniref:Uncharacterized protein n=1 Tax=Pleurodeles waltl TaxID=8319 RepID=A0AAV7PCX9_PLEWA|nr:hypothetical protein NDU88_002844 [Pleurodeles waltl]
MPRGDRHVDTSNLEVLRETTNPLAHPGDGWQREPFRTVTRLQKEELEDIAGGDVGTSTLNCGDSMKEEGHKDGGRVILNNGQAESSNDARTNQRPGRHPRKLRPCSGKSVANSDIPGGYISVVSAKI